MGCNCRQNGLAGSGTPQGSIRGYQVTYADGSKAPNLFNSPADAKKHVRLKGGGTIRQIVN